MKFEVINGIGNTVMHCESVSCIPNDEEISIMTKAGYKFKINGKIVNRKKIKEFIQNETR